MATRIEQEKPAGSLEPLELTSLRDDIREKPASIEADASDRRGRARSPPRSAVWGVAQASDAVGPGRWLACVLVAAWSAAAVFIARAPSAGAAEPARRRRCAGRWGGALADAFVGDASSSTSTKDIASAILSVAVAMLVAVGMHLALGLPDGALENRARRGLAIAGYVAALGLAAYLYTQRPDVPLAALTVAAGVAGLIGLVGYVRRCRRAATAQVRARLQWVAWGVVVAAAISLGAVVLNALLAWPEPIAAIAVASTVLVPFSLAMGASDQLAVRIDRLLVHSITLTGLVGLVGGSYLLIVLGLGRAPDGQRADAARTVDARGGRRRAALGAGARATRRSRDPPRLRRAATHPTKCSGRSAAA